MIMLLEGNVIVITLQSSNRVQIFLFVILF